MLASRTKLAEPHGWGGGSWAAWRRTVSDRRADERGASTIEFVITTPVVMLLIFGVFQASLFFHARSVAESAAEQGTAAARKFDATAADGQSATRQYLDQLASTRLLTGRQVAVTRGAAQVQTVVTGKVVSLLPVPFIHLDVRATSTGPVERYVPPVGDPR